MTSRHIRTYCELSPDCERLLERAMTQQGLSARAHDRILKVARTIADIEETPPSSPSTSPRPSSTARWTELTGLRAAPFATFSVKPRDYKGRSTVPCCQTAS